MLIITIWFPLQSADFINLYRFIVGVIAYTRERAFNRLKVDANDATFVWTNGITMGNNFLFIVNLTCNLLPRLVIIVHNLILQ